MKIVAMIPIKLNNERTPGKNTKRFSDGTPLIHCIQKTLLHSQKINEVYVYCSKDEIMPYLLEGVHFLKRDSKYDAADADVNEMFYDFSKSVEADIYVLAHATAPFQKSQSVDCGIRIVMSGQYDSALAVKKMQDFFWRAGAPMNYSPDNIVRTQDLKPIYMETTGLYIYNRDVISRLHRRIGERPYLLEVDEIEAIDINNPIDFEIADAIYNHIILKRRGI